MQEIQNAQRMNFQIRENFRQKETKIGNRNYDLSVSYLAKRHAYRRVCYDFFTSRIGSKYLSFV